MRLAINAWFLDQPGTGSGQYLQGLLRALAGLAADHQFMLVAPQDRASAVPGAESASPSPEDGAGSHFAPDTGTKVAGLKMEFWPLRAPFWRSNLGKVLFEQVAFPRVCRRWGADLAHVPYWGSPLGPTVPTLVTIHDLIPLLLPAYRGGALVRLYTRLVATSARRAAAVLTDSLASKRDIEAHLRLPAGHVQCVYLAADEHLGPDPDPLDEAIRHRYHLPSRYVLYLAGHDIRKNVAGLVEAFATVAQSDDDVSLVIGGQLPLRPQAPLFDPRPLVAALGIEDGVRFIGQVDEAHKPALLRGAACAVFPSRYEGFGLPVLEALACGTPLVASNTSSLPELVGDAGFALDPDDVRGLAGAILACLVDEPLAAELRKRGPQQAARFSWARTAQETLAAYETALRGEPVGKVDRCESS
jgi:glycosyltransferase involved in cell wall biosynthesis